MSRPTAPGYKTRNWPGYNEALVLPELLGRIAPDQEIGSITAGGVYDIRECHDAIAPRGAAAIIPSRRNAKPWKADTPGGGTQRGPACINALRAHDLATMERQSPPEPRKGENALRDAAGSASDRKGLRSSARRVPNPYCRPERLHRLASLSRKPRDKSVWGKCSLGQKPIRAAEPMTGPNR